MPFYVGAGCIPTKISINKIAKIARVDTSPEQSVLGKIKEFFCLTHESDALNCIREICHPRIGTTSINLANRFKDLKSMAYPGSEDNIQIGRHGDYNFCILDDNGQEILSVTLDDAGRYIVKCEEYFASYDLSLATTATLSKWNEWLNFSPPVEMSSRTKTLEKVDDCLSNRSTTLNVGYLTISSLPDALPQNITDLVTNNAQLNSLPSLPMGLQKMEIHNTPLTSLPELPSGLTDLSIQNASLTSLPELPSGLTDLSIQKTSLTSLPVLPEGLRKLRISDITLTSLPELPITVEKLDLSKLTALTSLPVLPEGLRELHICDTPLTSLPALPSTVERMSLSKITPLNSLPVLPSGLQELMICGTPLTSLPALPAGLGKMYVDGTALTRLPESICRLPRDAHVTLYGCPLSERTRQDLHTLTSAPGYAGPVIYFDMSGPSVLKEVRELHLAVADWLPAGEGDASPAGRWQTFGQEKNAGAFSAFLDRLKETENVKKDAGFKAQTGFWLTQLGEDDELREKTFDMATEATSTCEDRVTLALNQMKNVRLVHNAEKGEFDRHPAELVSVGREMFRLDKLEQIAREKAGKLLLIDEIEVYLAYQYKLKAALELSSVAAEMRFFDVSGVKEDDVQAAELQVKTAENSQFVEWLLRWEPLRSVLKRTETERWAALEEKKTADYEEQYRLLSESELKPAGLGGVTEAERVIGARALESAEKGFIEGLRPVAERVLAGYLGVRWREVI